MKGFGAFEKGKTGWMERPDPVIKNPDDVLIKTTAVAMCTSDVHMVETGVFPGIFGGFLGHEAVGVVEAVGSGIKDFKPGDRVMISAISPEFGNYWAQIGKSSFAPGVRSITPGMDGMFSEYILFERGDSGLAHIPDNVTDLQALMMVDMGSTAMGGIEALDIQPGETVAVIGIGPVGLTAVEELATGGAGKIIAVGHREATRKVAWEMGASAVIDYKDGSVLEQVRAANNGKPVDKVLLCGSYEGVLLDAFRMTRPGGIVANVAMMPRMEEPIPAIGCGDVTYTSVRDKCGRFYLENLLALVEYGRLHPERIISHTYHGFESIPEAYEKMANKTEDLIKTVCIF